MIRLPREITREVSRKFRECAAKVQVPSLRAPNSPQAASPCVGSWHGDWVELCLILFGTVVAQMLQVTLRGHAARCLSLFCDPMTMLCDEAAKDPRKIFFREEWHSRMKES